MSVADAAARCLRSRGFRILGCFDPAVGALPDRGPQARICRLDTGALETAVGLVADRLSSGADILIVKKFGKLEAEGLGFRDVIAQAIAMDVPVKVRLNALNRDAFEAFSGSEANQLAPDLAILERCVQSVAAVGAVSACVPCR
ncbi:Protein of unknown function [Citreimonas salinaria]|uniref:DUF2478 domain-containing protein n=1 Tax=Citreimonas salinaria TaxID=321339 RepID=A0A1H3NRK6_9RHOB|nr:Protein of unknown function [Citreimonas salinaria]